MATVSAALSKIRLARPSDLPELLAMMGAFNREDRVAWRRERVVPALRKLLGDRRLGRVIVSEARRGGELRGYAVATFGYDLEYAGRDAFLTELFVRPEHRGAGHGRRLLQTVIEIMGEGGAAAIHLAVWPTNRTARRLYEASGFAPIPRLVLSKRLYGKRSTAR
jgi:ribosomal protein S18 acetylase RimI-like enzyme